MNKAEIFHQVERLGKEITFYHIKEIDTDNVIFLAADITKWVECRDVEQLIKGFDLTENEVITAVIPSKIFIETNGYIAKFLTDNTVFEILMQSRSPMAKLMRTQMKAVLKEKFIWDVQKIAECLVESEKLGKEDC